MAFARFLLFWSINFKLNMVLKVKSETINLYANEVTKQKKKGPNKMARKLQCWR